MNKIDECVDLEKRVDAVLNYYKLLFVEDDCMDKCFDTFLRLDGEQLFNTLLSDIKEGYIELDNSHTLTLLSFILCFIEIKQQRHSINPLTTKKLKNVDWLFQYANKLSSEGRLNDKLSDTILENANSEIFANILKDNEIFKDTKSYNLYLKKGKRDITM